MRISTYVFRTATYAALIALGCACGKRTAPAPAASENDAGAVAKTQGDATKTPDSYLIVRLRSVRIYDSNAPHDPDDLPRIRSNYVNGPRVPVQIDSLDVRRYSKRVPPPQVLDESRTIAIRSSGLQTFQLELAGSYRLQFQVDGFRPSSDGSSVALAAKLRSNYAVRLNGEGAAIGPNTVGFSGDIGLGSQILQIANNNRAGRLFFGIWLGIAIERISASPPDAAMVAPEHTRARQKQQWRNWKRLTKSTLQ